MNDWTKQFDISLDRFIDKVVPEQLAQLQRVITIQTLRGVVLRTPVDTGRARGGWQVSLETPIVTDTGRADKSGGETISAGVATAANIKPFSVSFVQNNVVYILPLENGSSQQAANGMLGVTVNDIQAQFR